ncbi:acyltransferase-domain-containing protein [Polyporus arcularius HHB13444]|uniref:Acyltransferase-domain-containing protein n=1 Tax=Polyporus arcularius HHB13444 TaxID=1314778 RepID=A0A5C3PPC8_9APHY|nr:acyltransferase-domain-containing protein [Polyporus arcularius HHB13444]
MSDAYLAHRIIRRIAGWAVVSFFTEIHVIGGENVPKQGPIIVTATHHNMMLDPAVLSCAFPYKRVLHYWAKASLFANPVMKYVLTSAGNIPVDRKASDKRVLFQGTFRTLAAGEAVALFPEGTSYTEPQIMQVKDGAAWAALEYTKWAKENPDKVQQGAEKVVIVPAAIVYTNKSKYRSQVIMEDTLYAARMARDLLWPGERSINLDEFVTISQTLVDLFSTPDLVPNINAIRRHLLTYYSLLESTHLTNAVLSSLPLSAALDPRQPVPIPSRLLTLSILVRDSVALLLPLPFSIIPIILHAPAYVMGRIGARLVEDEEETQAQNKVVFGLLLLLMIYPAAFFFVWAFLWYTPVGALVALTFVFGFARYHNWLINDSYDRAKRLVAAWRVLVGVWAPKRWDMSLSAMAQYTVPRIPPENPWIDRSKARSKSRPVTPSTSSTALSGSSPSPSNSSSPTPPSPSPSEKRRRPPSRRLIRHVLLARVDAAKALASLFAQLERAPDSKRVRASVHLARAYGGQVEPLGENYATEEGVEPSPEPVGWRSAREVVAFLRARGAKFRELEIPVEGDWAALSDGEGEGYDSETVSSSREDDIVWVAPGQR